MHINQRAVVAELFGREKGSIMSNQKQRHGCLTAFLIVMIIANALVAVVNLAGGSAIRQTMPHAPDWFLPLMVAAGIFNVVCAIALFKWKKWGFWGFCASSIVALILNISSGIGIPQSLFGLLGLAILFGVLHIGKENKGWPQLD